MRRIVCSELENRCFFYEEPHDANVSSYYCWFVDLRLVRSGASAEAPTAAAAPVAHRVFAVDNGHAAIVSAKGEVEWEYPCPTDGHDSSMLDNGNVLLRIGGAKIAEVSPDKKIVWQYESKPKAGYNGHVEVHSFQRLPDGLTMIAEGGNRRIVEIDKDGKIVHQIPLFVEHPNPHVDTRMARKLDNGHYLVCQGGDSTVREYDGGRQSCVELQARSRRPARFRRPRTGRAWHGALRRGPAAKR